MSIFNQAQYNRAGFNVDTQTKEIFVTAEGFAKITAVVSTASDIMLDISGNEKVSSNAVAIPTKFVTASGLEDVRAEGAGNTYFWFSINARETVGGEANSALTAMLDIDGSETITGNIGLSTETMFADIEGTEDVNSETTISQNVVLDFDGYELITAIGSLEAMEEYVCTLNLTLQPGKKVIIDANNYNVLLDGKNAIDKQSGDWLDELNRDTINISLSALSGANNITATILYTERYL